MLIIYGMNRHILIEAVNCAFALARVSNSCRFTFIDCCECLDVLDEVLRCDAKR